MSGADHINQVCKSLLALPTWTANVILQHYAWQLDFEQSPPPTVKKYRGKIADPCFDVVTLRQPLYGGKLGWAIGLHLQSGVAVSFDELAPFLPAKFSGGVHPPAIGGTGPASTGTWRTWDTPDGRLTLQFERAAGSALELVKNVSLGRDKFPDSRDYERLDRYRAVEVNDEHGRSYVIEDGATLEGKLRIEGVSVRDRQLKLSYAYLDPFISAQLARRLIRHALFDQLIRSDLEGKVDRVEYADLESKQAVVKGWTPSP